MDGARDRRRGAPRDRAARARGGGGVTLADPTELVPFSRWITPEEVKVRYDTRFYLALAPRPLRRPSRTARRSSRSRWFAPAEALERHRAGEMLLVFPTIKQLETLARVRLARGGARQRSRPSTVEPILPAGRRERARAARAAAGRPGLLKRLGSRPRAGGRSEEPVAQLGLAGEAVGLRIVARVDHDLAAGERRRHQARRRRPARPRPRRPAARSGPAM